MESFKRLNTIGGILMGIFATLIYTLTMESSASLWDCGEFIAACYKLQVVHPPGAPNFLMLGRMFSLLAFGNPEMIPLTLNFMSALSSGLAMMFLFWITTHLAGIVLRKSNETQTDTNAYLILGCGLIAGLTGTFLDSIWFSAVEAEVYSTSLCFTAAVFWLICKWESVADEPYADRYLLLIAFLMGISIFIHWLNLLCIPALSLVYYFKRFNNPNWTGILISLVLSVAVLLFFLSGIITGIVDMMASLELSMVNDMGMPFNTGVILFVILFIGLIVGGLWFTSKRSMAIAHNVLLAFMFVIIGFSTITTVVIRSNAEPYIDMNSPRDVVSLSSYLNRDQYGTRPIFFGYYYTDEPKDINYTGTRWAKGKEKYEKVGRRFEYDYGNTRKKFFARMYDSKHKTRYENWVGLKKGQRPSFADNFVYFIKYQINHMYIRYFMWNFVGRQNDDQGTGESENGNWLSGIGFVDNLINGRLEPQSNLPEDKANHPARNTYFFIPLLIGILGFVTQLNKDRRHALIIGILFLMTGVALIIYGNSPPLEPRERDYIFAASFYTFAIWVGLGVLGMYTMLKKFVSGTPGVALAIALCILAPTLMAFQNWDDHDRSGRTAARDFAKNYLESCAPNAILFTQGDNDTYPLWYAQEVENIRPDVRIVNLSLLGVDWYIKQCRRKVNDAEAVPFTLAQNKIQGTKRDQVLFQENTRIAEQGKYFELSEIMKFIGNDANQLNYGRGEKLSYYPTKNFSIPINRNEVVQNGCVPANRVEEVTGQMKWQLKKNNILKNDLMVLDIIAAVANDGWKRPIYFAISVDRNAFMGLQKYFHAEGLAYRLMPIEANLQQGSPFSGDVNVDAMKENLMSKFTFGGLDKEGTYPGTDLRRMSINLRNNYTRLADKLIELGRTKEAVEVLDYAQQKLLPSNIPHDIYSFPTVLAYYDAEEFEKGNQLAEVILNTLFENLVYYEKMSPRNAKRYKSDSNLYKNYVAQFLRTAEQNGQTEFSKRMKDKQLELGI